MNKTMTSAILLLILYLSAFPQQSKEETEETLRQADINANNIQTAIAAHLTGESRFVLKKQEPELTLRCFDILVFKGSIKLDWTTGQHARCRMEDLRQGIHELQAADQPLGLDAIVLPAARSLWPELRDIVCHEYPGVQYYGLDGFEQFCPEAVSATTPKQVPKPKTKK